ncbi:type III-B CRISPR module-associated Cmr3 family protein [Nocardia nova]
MRGAFAAAWIARHGEPSHSPRRAEFVELFEGPTIFGPLYSARPPTPASLRIHKYLPRESCRPSFWDEALPSVIAPSHCPKCHSPLQQAKPADNPLPTPDITAPRAVFTRTHVAIGDDGIAVDGKLFQREENNPAHAPRYTGRIEAATDVLEILRSYPRLRIGGRLTTSGSVTASLVDQPFRPPHVLDDHHVVVRLCAPGIFVTSTGTPAAQPEPTDLQHRLGTPARVIRKWARWSEVGGWHAASGLPKHVDRAVDAGSTYLIETEHPLTPVHLDRLKYGLGIRRHEGFGAVGGVEHDPSEWS